MWGCLVARSYSGHVFMVLNSFIHTIMYFYYAMSSINIRLPGKKHITQAQMIQFVIANGIAFTTWLNFGHCMTFEDKFVGFYHVFYTGGVFLLFGAFYSKAYNKGKAKSKFL